MFSVCFDPDPLLGLPRRGTGQDVNNLVWLWQKPGIPSMSSLASYGCLEDIFGPRVFG